MGGLDQQGFIADEKTADAVVRNLEVIGEAAARLPEEDPLRAFAPSREPSPAPDLIDDEEADVA